MSQRDIEFCLGFDLESLKDYAHASMAFVNCIEHLASGGT